jgi:uncharacterized delta-60 repeat protein
MKILPEGGLVIGGDFERINGQLRTSLAWILAAGSPDGGFAPQGERLSFVESLEVDRNGQVYVGVEAESELWFQQTVRRYRPDGSVDPTYATLNLGSIVRDQFLDASGDLVVCGSPDPAVPGLGALVRLGPDGSIRSNAFPGSGPLFSTFAMLPMHDGSVICGGDFGYHPASPGPHYIARLDPDGALDSTFRITNESGEEQLLDSVVTSLTRDSKGRIVLGGEFQRAGTQNVPGLLRLLPDGRLDPSFQPSFKGFNVEEVWVDSEDRIVARGDFFFSEITYNRTVVRVLLDGSVDPTFPVITAPLGSVAVQGNAVYLSTGESPFPGDLSGQLIRIAPSQKLPFVTARVDATGGELELRLTPGTDAPLRLESSPDLKTWSLVGPAEPVMRISVTSGESGAYYRVVEVR